MFGQTLTRPVIGLAGDCGFLLDLAAKTDPEWRLCRRFEMMRADDRGNHVSSTLVRVDLATGRVTELDAIWTAQPITGLVVFIPPPSMSHRRAAASRACTGRSQRSASLPVISWPRMELITVGEAFEDLIFLDLPRLPRLGEEVRTRQFVATMGGGAVISAVAAARLGIHCRIVSGLSDAAAARLTREGIGFENLRHPEERPAISAALSVGGNRSFVTFNGVNDSLEPRFRRALDKQTARHVHFAFHPRSCQRWARAVTRLRRASVTTSWDFGWNEALLRDRSFEHLVTSLDYVFFNRQEAVLYARHRRMAAAVAYWRQLRANVVIKLGSHGSRWLGEVDLRMPARRARVVDTTGAGDAFNGGFLAARLRGLDARTSLGLGNLVGTASIGRAGGVDGLPALADLPGPLRRLLTATRAPQRPTASPGHPRDGRKRR